MNFNALSAHDTCPAPAETAQKSQAHAAQCTRHAFLFCARSLCAARVFGAETAQFCRRKPRDFCIEMLENQRDCSRRRAQNADETLREYFDACFAGRAGFSELCSAVCTEICAKTSRFSIKIAKVSMKFDAVVAHHARPAPAKTAQKSQACVTHCAVHVRCF